MRVLLRKNTRGELEDDERHAVFRPSVPGATSRITRSGICSVSSSERSEVNAFALSSVMM
jgi:hypothetical protein